MHSDAHERGATLAFKGHKDQAKRPQQMKQQLPTASGRKVQGDKLAPGKEARGKPKEGFAQEATFAKKAWESEQPEKSGRGSEGQVSSPETVNRTTTL